MSAYSLLTTRCWSLMNVQAFDDAMAPLDPALDAGGRLGVLAGFPIHLVRVAVDGRNPPDVVMQILEKQRRSPDEHLLGLFRAHREQRGQQARVVLGAQLDAENV